eukprot:CAMPEP_0194393590 /NCGR_PEP_ID=MMETSP0174-20130528/123382_1 /TAXON_ID=216777 /ORGANISM="Proboscia alata, Strain PI-D3" /LENGTH=76 /DNA_ID=CAMNT_0039189291 /DNA_START=839 /DNA_END=1066 /DNA_ORIENTATION=-
MESRIPNEYGRLGISYFPACPTFFLDVPKIPALVDRGEIMAMQIKKRCMAVHMKFFVEDLGFDDDITVLMEFVQKN